MYSRPSAKFFPNMDQPRLVNSIFFLQENEAGGVAINHATNPPSFAGFCMIYIIPPTRVQRKRNNYIIFSCCCVFILSTIEHLLPLFLTMLKDEVQ